MHHNRYLLSPDFLLAMSAGHRWASSFGSTSWPSTLAYVSPIYLQLIWRRTYFYWERVCVQVIRYTKLEPLSFGSNGHFMIIWFYCHISHSWMSRLSSSCQFYGLFIALRHCTSRKWRTILGFLADKVLIYFGTGLSVLSCRLRIECM